MRNSWYAGALALVMAAPLAAQSTFEDLPYPGTGGVPIPNGYLGLTWTNFYYIDGCGFDASSGYCAGSVSPTNVAYNGFGDEATISGTTPFDFESAWFTAAWNDDLIVRVDGYSDGAQVDDAMFRVDTSSPFFFDAAWNNIDTLIFSSFVPGGGYEGQTQFAMDDITIQNIVDPTDPPDVDGGGDNGNVASIPGDVDPEPATMTLMATGLVGLAGAASRRKR